MTRDVTQPNGVDTTMLFVTVDAMRHAPATAQFQFRARGEWVDGTHSRSTISDFFGVGDERRHAREFVVDADHPAALSGHDDAPAPVEFVLHALASCLIAGIASIAAARRVALSEIRSTVSGDIDLSGILGIEEVRNGFQQVTVDVVVRGDADESTLREIVEQARRRSAVHDVLASGVPVDIQVEIA